MRLQKELVVNRPSDSEWMNNVSPSSFPLFLAPGIVKLLYVRLTNRREAKCMYSMDTNYREVGRRYMFSP